MQRPVAEAAPPEQEEARFATFGHTKGKGALGYKSGKALSLRDTRALPVQPAGERPAGTVLCLLTDSPTGPGAGKAAFDSQPFLSRGRHCSATSDLTSIYVNAVHYGDRNVLVPDLFEAVLVVSSGAG